MAAAGDGISDWSNGAFEDSDSLVGRKQGSDGIQTENNERSTEPQLGSKIVPAQTYFVPISLQNQ